MKKYEQYDMFAWGEIAGNLDALKKNISWEVEDVLLYGLWFRPHGGTMLNSGWESEELEGVLAEELFNITRDL